MKSVEVILKEIERRVEEYYPFDYELTARICIAELNDLYDWIKNRVEVDGE